MPTTSPRPAPANRSRVIRRRARIVILCLLLGIGTTIAVAWALVLDVHRATRPMKFASARVIPGRPEMSVSRRDSFGGFSLAAAMALSEPYAQATQTFDLDDVVPTWARAELLDWKRDPTQPGPPDGAARAILVTGLPWPSLWSSYDQQPSSNYWWFKARNGIVISQAPAVPNFFAMLSPRERVLPLRVVWPAFIIDTCVWAVAWGVLLATPIAIRRTWRKRRGLCLTCGYDRRGHAPDHPCPECGQPHGA